MISWICSESMIRPSFCISSIEASRVACDELVAVGDQVLDREPADDRAQVTVEDLADEVVHLALLGVQEARAGVGDRALVVADLEDRHAAHADRDLLDVDALDLEHRLVGRHAEVLRLLQHGHDERAAAGDDLEDPVADRSTLDAEPGDDQRLIGGWHLPQRLEQDRQKERDPDDEREHDDQRGVHLGLLREGCDEHDAWRLVIDDDDLGVGRDLAAVDVAGENASTPPRIDDHDLAGLARADRTGGGDTASAADRRGIDGHAALA